MTKELVLAVLLCACSEKSPSGDADSATDDATDPDASTDALDAADTPADAVPDATPDVGCTTVMEVSTASELRDALSSASPGTAIELASGTYDGQFDVQVSGEDGAWICIRGHADRSAVLNGHSEVGSWQGVLTLEGRHHVLVEDLEVHNTPAERYGVLVGASDYGEDGCHHVTLHNLHVHDTGEEIIKIQGLNTHHITVEDCIVHSNLDWSGIDIQGHWGGTPPYDQKPHHIIIRRNLVYDIPGFAGIGNEVADNVQVLDNVVLGSAIGMDIGCGNYNVLSNNLITGFAHFNELLEDPSYTAIDLSRYLPFSDISSFTIPTCLDGIALSGNYMSLVMDNEVTGCMGNGDLVLSYNHLVDGAVHNYDHIHDIEYGHRSNLFLRNRFHHNDAWYTVREYDKQDTAVSRSEIYLANLFAVNDSDRGILFEHSNDLLFINNTIAGDDVQILEESLDATLMNNLLFSSSVSVTPDSTGSNVSHNHETTSESVFASYPDDFHLASAPNPCIDSGEDLSATLDPLLSALDGESAEYAWYPEFPVALDFALDLDGDAQTGDWDIGFDYVE